MTRIFTQGSCSLTLEGPGLSGSDALVVCRCWCAAGPGVLARMQATAQAQGVVWKDGELHPVNRSSC